MRKALLVAAVFALASCGGEEHGDLKQELNNLTMDAVARTFRYLDDDEIADQRRAAKKGPAKK